MKASLREADGSAAVPSSVPENELAARGPRVAIAPVGWLVDAHASGHEQLEHGFRAGFHGDSGRSTLEGLRSRRADAQPFLEVLPGDP
jgi:hypothetical protein